MIRLFPKDNRNRTVAVFDTDAKVYEIFADRACDSYIGCADTIPEAKEISQNWSEEL